MDIQKIIFQVGGFTWSGHFTWVDIPPSELARRGSPIAPTRYIHLLVFCCCFCMSFSSSLCPGPQPWLVDCLLLQGTHSGLWAPTTQRWMSGEVRPSSSTDHAKAMIRRQVTRWQSDVKRAGLHVPTTDHCHTMQMQMSASKAFSCNQDYG